MYKRRGCVWNMKRRVVFQKKRQNKTGIFLVMLVIIMLVFVVTIRSSELEETLAGYESKIESLEEQVLQEEIRSEELAEEEKRVQTQQYAEEIAKDNLGLVYEDEIIFTLED